MVDSHKNDRPDQHAPAEAKAVKSQDAQEARHAGAQEIATVEAGRTNASDGSARKRLQFVGDQQHSIEIEADGVIASRTNKLSEKDLLSRSPVQKLEDFIQAATRRASDPAAYKAYLQQELDKTIGIGEGLNLAKENTKQSVKVAWTALTDGTVVNILCHPKESTDAIKHTVGHLLEAIPKDRESYHRALDRLGEELIKANNTYTHMSSREKGRVIGETMFGMVNPEGSTAGAESLIKIARDAGGHLDGTVLQTLRKSVAAAHELSRNTPRVAEHAKQMLLDYTVRLGLTPQEMDLAGIPKGYFAGMVPSTYGRFTEDLVRLPETHIAPPRLAPGERDLLKMHAQSVAIKLLIRAEEAETKITPKLIDLAEKNGGELQGLDHRLKSVDSLTRKLETGKAADTIKDALRYTMSFSDEQFTGGVKEVISQLERDGLTLIKVKNTFGPRDIYKGLNCAFKLPDGQKFELQFHTPDSLAIKQKNHIFYEAAREMYKEDPISGNDILCSPETLVHVGRKYYADLKDTPFLQALAGRLGNAQNAIEGHALLFRDALFEKMKQNYGSYIGPPGAETFESFG